MNRVFAGVLFALLAIPAVLAIAMIVLVAVTPDGLTNLGLVVSEQPRLITNTLTYGALSGVLATGLGWLLAHVHHSYALPGRKLLHLATLAGILMPSITFAMAVVMLFGNSGLLLSTLGWGGSYGLVGLVVASTFARLPVAYLSLTWAYRNLDVRVLEAAHALGASGPRVVRSILLPRLGATLVANACAMTADTVADLAVPLVVGGDFGTLAGALYEAISGEGDVALAVAYGLCLAPMGLILQPLARWFYARPQPPRNSREARLARPITIRGWLLIGGCWLVVGFSTLLLGAVVYGSLVYSVGVDERPTLAHFIAVVTGPHTRALATTVLISLLAVGLVMALAAGFTRAALTGPVRHTRRLVTVLAGVPGVVLGLGVYLLAQQVTSRWPTDAPSARLVPWVAMVAVLTVHVMRFTPSATAPMINTARQLAGSISDTALSLGVSQTQVAHARLVPRLRPQYEGGAATVFARTLTAISSVILLTNAQVPLLSVRMLVSVDAGRLSAAAAMNVVLAILVGAAFWAARLLGGTGARVRQ